MSDEKETPAPQPHVVGGEPSDVAKLRSALQAAVDTIQDYLSYTHDGDPWKEDSRAMGEMDINDYGRDGRLEYALAALSAATTDDDACPSCGGSGRYGDAARRAIDGDIPEDTRDLLMSIETAAVMAEQGVLSADGGQAAVEIRSLIPVRFRAVLASTEGAEG